MPRVIAREVELEEWLSHCHCAKSADDYITDGVLGIKKEYIEEWVDLEGYDITPVDETLPIKDFSRAVPFELPSEIKLDKNTWELKFVAKDNCSFNYFYVRLIYDYFDVVYLKILATGECLLTDNGDKDGYVLLFYDENDKLIALLPSMIG